MAEILISLWVILILVILGSGLCMLRLHRFSKFMRAEIQLAHEARACGNYALTYPDVMASYNNLKWYDMFNYNFHSLIVYVKR
jgi:hypothetical protein